LRRKRDARVVVGDDGAVGVEDDIGAVRADGMDGGKRNQRISRDVA
jgi:hypothetical protein